MSLSGLLTDLRHGILPELPAKPAGPEPVTYSVENKDPEESKDDDDLIDDREYAKFRCAKLTSALTYMYVAHSAWLR